MARTILTMEQVNEQTGIPVDTLRYWRKRNCGEGPRSFRLGRRVVYTQQDLDDWIDSQRDAERQGVA